ncbi:MULTISPECIES: cardiolipin synthase [unclassified Bacillus (in: firmicutes)]|uniref:cardiolipin synthase n=1 Tax=unclassified Bacillus (in: firmicutes) TaxID=185979 RepID=UPI0008E4CB55|nr:MULTISPECIES: cardiolipin synthase [unclassified Bacillus (in: firmicutes)]SFA87731.1 cardiolipin synthase [Bacillus sp. UNCCL13]SFQ84376.1 cardiolipin synthase [Bacillus sp. cl95]
MKKQRIEFLFVIVLAAALYIVFFTDYNYVVKGISIGIYAIIILISMYSLILENRSSHHTLLWMYVLLCFPLIGYLFYLYSGQLYLKGYLFKSKRSYDREEWQKLLRKDSSTDLTFLQDNQQEFATYASRASFTTPNTASQSTILKNGKETFDQIKKQLQEAESFIHMEYYIFRSDRLGEEIVEILIEKAKAGVEVLFMFDAAGSLKLGSALIKKMIDAGIKAYPFSPLKLGFVNQKFNFRNHRKIVVIDGKVGFVGGLNVGIEYLGEDENFGFWRDTHVMLEGEAVNTLHHVFLLDWEYVSGEDVIGRYETVSSPFEEGTNGAVQVVASGPDTQQGIMGDYYFSMMMNAKQSIWIATPYFVPDEAIRTALRVAATKGIEVRILVPEKNDSILTEYATRSYFPELLRCGAEIYMYQKGFLHQKIIIVDGNLASIGTANMDMRSFHLNFEVNVFLYGTTSIRDLVAQFEEDLKDSVRIRPVEYYKRSFWMRTKESFARLFSGVL